MTEDEGRKFTLEGRVERAVLFGHMYDNLVTYIKSSDDKSYRVYSKIPIYTELHLKVFQFRDSLINKKVRVEVKETKCEDGPVYESTSQYELIV